MTRLTGTSGVLIRVSALWRGESMHRTASSRSARRSTRRRLSLVTLTILLATALAGCLQGGDAGPPGPAASPPSSTPEPAAQPEPAPAPVTDAWPREGSFATYRVTSSGGSPGGAFESRVLADVTYTFEAGRWTASCEGTRQTLIDGAPTAEEPVHSPVMHPPPRVAENADGTVRAHVLAGCSTLVLPLTGDTPGHGAATDDCTCRAAEATWDAESRLVTHWWSGGGGSGVDGTLVDTDAPR